MQRMMQSIDSQSHSVQPGAMPKWSGCNECIFDNVQRMQGSPTFCTYLACQDVEAVGRSRRLGHRCGCSTDRSVAAGRTENVRCRRRPTSARRSFVIASARSTHRVDATQAQTPRWTGSCPRTRSGVARSASTFHVLLSFCGRRPGRRLDDATVPLCHTSMMTPHQIHVNIITSRHRCVGSMGEHNWVLSEAVPMVIMLSE